MAEIEKFSIIDKVLDLWRRRKWLVLIFFLPVFTVAVCLIVALPQLYRASTTILFTQDEVAESLLKTGARNELELRLVTIRQAVMSRTQLQEIIEDFDLYPQLQDRASPESIINRFRRDIRIEQQATTTPAWGQNSTYAITISYQDWDPDRAALIANELVARYRAENERIRTGQAASATQFVSEQLDTAKARFEAQEQRKNEFKNAHLGELPEQHAFNMASLDRLNYDLRLNVERQVHLLERRAEVLPGASGSSPGIGAAGLTGNRRLEWLKRELAELETRYTANHPDIIRLHREIDSLTLELAGTGGVDKVPSDLQQSGQRPTDVESELNALRKEEGTLRTDIASLVQSLEGTPRIEQELERFAHDYEAAKSEYLALQQLYQNANLVESLETRQHQQFRIIEVAIPPEGPVAPNRNRLLIIGFILAAAVAGGALFLTELLDGSFHSLIELRRFTSVPVLASIPRIKTPGEHWRSRAHFSLISGIFVAGLLVLAVFSFYVGSHAEQLVLTISS